MAPINWLTVLALRPHYVAVALWHGAKEAASAIEVVLSITPTLFRYKFYHHLNELFEKETRGI